MKNENQNNFSLDENILVKYHYPISVIIILIFSQITDWYFPLSLILFALTILMVLQRLGKGIVLRELIALHSLFICIVMPILGYTMFNIHNTFARTWVRYMPIPKEQYFSFAFPAMGLFVLSLCWPVGTQKISDQGILLQNAFNKAKQKLTEIPYISVYIVITGVLMSIISNYLPGGLQFFATLFFWGAFAGVLYIYYTPNFKYKKLILSVFALLILVNSLQSGMFTIIAYMGITLFSFFFLGRKMMLWKKLSIFIAAAFLLILIQSVKHTYRRLTWKEGYQGSKIALFSNLISDKLTNVNTLFDEGALFPLYYRANQGFNVALVMRRFPSRIPFDNGKNLLLNLASSVVPRLLWPNKPEAGGKFNMKYYVGMDIKTFSTNVGPLGEAYGSFGVTGGIIYMFFLGAFIRWAYKRVYIIAYKLPLLIFWIPVMFYQVTYSAESDTLQILNSVIKSAFFVWMLVKILPKWFGKVNNVPTPPPLPKNLQNTSLVS
jgi:hypothetical protein